MRSRTVTRLLGFSSPFVTGLVTSSHREARKDAGGDDGDESDESGGTSDVPSKRKRGREGQAGCHRPYLPDRCRGRRHLRHFVTAAITAAASGPHNRRGAPL